ncbi:MAG TPA: 30S ribosome-binding factor RbfA [Myxococcota bacterium]|nr:30S ribosome-binding factor RbfA [Myxococcota bacterium]
MRSYKRTDRIASLIKQAMSEIFLYEVHDPKIQAAIVSHVIVTPDIGLARIYVRTMLHADEEQRLELLEELANHKGFLRAAMAKKINLMRAPRLEFYFDDFQDEVARIDELLAKLNAPDGFHND